MHKLLFLVAVITLATADTTVKPMAEETPTTAMVIEHNVTLSYNATHVSMPANSSVPTVVVDKNVTTHVHKNAALKNDGITAKISLGIVLTSLIFRIIL